VHVASTKRLTHYGYDAHRGRTAISEINILPGYRGTLVHDGWLLSGRQARNLLLRLERRKEEVLRFMTDFTVGFDNNQGRERLENDQTAAEDQWMLSERRWSTPVMSDRSYLSTMSKQGKSMMQALERACEGRPLRPTS
jgi:hypothetical protein